MNYYLFISCIIFTLSSNAQKETEYLSRGEIEKDLAFLDDILQKKSSYQGLNGYDYQVAFTSYLEAINDTPITATDFGLFLSATIGNIGDRHAYIKGYDLPESLYFPVAFAPHQGKVLVIDYDRSNKEYSLWNSEFPYLKSINKTPIEELLPKILPREVLAPKSSYALRAVRDLRDIETVFSILKTPLPNPLTITLTNDNGLDKKLEINLVDKGDRARIWDERYHKKDFFLKEEQLKDKGILEQFFSMENNIGYIQIADMLSEDDSPAFFELLNGFMEQAQNSDALIIDVRDNVGGTRDLIQALAGYFIHPDSVYVVNATRQRGPLPLNRKSKKDLHNRYLFSADELDKREQYAVDHFATSFKPMYDLDDATFSDFHYYVLNGQKLTKGKYHYNKPIYILANERTFSAASVLVAAFKGLPNIQIVGVNTDGSSGNSERFELPNSGLRGKISTMVSFQKGGQVLDGIGTEPDIVIERSLDQILFKEDYQLLRLKELIRE